jgi:serine/threonine-protein kinase
MPAPDDLLWSRWEEIDRVLEGALELPSGERASHVARLTDGDDRLRELVMRLLHQLDSDAGRLGGPGEQLVHDAFGLDSEAASPDLDQGMQVGSYVIVGRRGRGGMATVYEAARADGAYEQHVALKVLRRGLDTDDLIRRFRTERQILSSLSHPNIARLLDGGSLSDGRPYLVMELVDGKPITPYADAARLSLRERLQLFLAVADAVRAAHRQLVVHRDIKPSNILVDAQGHVKLLDFGIAKLLDADAGHTEAGSRALTPDYASPEQLRGGPITTSTDVYQLGLLLRELLTGLPPLAGDSRDARRPSRLAGAHITGIPDATARAAARGTTPPALARSLGGDLDLIVDKSLRVEPSERYGSAEELAADVRRHLEGHPVDAHPESVSYRMRKFVGRHPLFLPGAAAATVAILGFMTVLTLQNRRITRERDAAQVATRRALTTQNFLVSLLRSPDPTTSTGNREVTVIDALQRGRSRVATELEDEPHVHAALLEAMGRTFSGLGRFETADTLLRESLALYTELYGPSSPQLADPIHAMAINHRAERAFATADSLFHEELRLRLAALGPASGDTAIAGLLAVMSGTRRDLGDQDSAVALAARAVTAHRNSGDSSSRAFTAVLGNLAYVLRGANKLDSAEVIYREVLRRQLNTTGTPASALSLTHNNLGFLLRTGKRYAEAETAYREAHRLSKDALGGGHATTLMIGSNLASVLELQGKLDDVLEIGRANIAEVEAQWPGGHWRVGSAHAALGRFLLRHDRAAEALDALQAAVGSFAATLGPRHAWTAGAEVDLGTALVVLGRAAEGAPMLARAHAVFVALPADLTVDARLNLERAASVLEKHGHGEQARPFRALLGKSAG